MSYPRYVPHSTGDGKWTDSDINAVVAHVLAGESVSGYLAFPYAYIIRNTAGVYDAINNVGTQVYGGADDAGSVDGGDADAVRAAVITALVAAGGGLIKYGAGSFEFNATLDVGNNIVEEGCGEATQFLWTGTGAAPDNFIANTTKPLVRYQLRNLLLDVNDVADVSPIVLDTAQKCVVSDVSILDSEDTFAIELNATSAGNNSYSNVFKNINMYDVGGAFKTAGTASGTEVTLTRLDNIHAYHIHGAPVVAADVHTGVGIGISFGGWSSGLLGSNVWLDLQDAGGHGVIWNNSATHDANTGDYDNSFVKLYIDTFGDANHADSTLLTFNYTKMDVIKQFFHSPAVNTFLGTCIDDQHSFSYWIEDVTSGADEPAATQDVYVRLYQKGYMYGNAIFDNIALYANDSESYISVNDLYAAENARIILRTNDGSDREAEMSMNAADGVFRLNAPTGKNFYIKLGDNAAGNSLEIHDSDDAAVVAINSNGLVDSDLGFSVAGNVVVAAQQAAITAPAGGATVDAEARTAIGSILTALRTHGLIDT